MKVIFSTLAITLLSFNSCLAQLSFIAIDQSSGEALQSQGELSKRVSPCSTFKIPLAVIGMDSGILSSSTSPEWTITKEHYVGDREVCYGPHTPQSWLKYSVVPYSQIMTRKLGMEKFQEYVTKLGYGNEDVAGAPDKLDGLEQCWLSSSLQISPQEQIDFLDKLTREELPVSEESQEIVKSMLYLDSIVDGWKLYGKTGGGWQQNAEGSPTNLKLFWFVGWVEKDGQRILFAANVKESKPSDSWPDNPAKKEVLHALEILLKEPREKKKT